MPERKRSSLSPRRGFPALLAALALLFSLRPASAAAEEAPLRVLAPEDAVICLDGEALGGAAQEDDPLFAGLEAYTGGAVRRTVLTLPADTDPEALTALSPEGEALEALILDGEVRFLPAGDEALRAEAEPRVREFFTWYDYYGSNAFNSNLYYALLGCTLAGSPLYDHVLYSNDAMVWACGTRLENGELSLSRFERVGERCFRCLARERADCEAVNWFESFSYSIDNCFELVFVYEGWTWYAAAMERLPLGLPEETGPAPGLRLVPVVDGRVKGTLLLVDDPKRVILGVSEGLGSQAGLPLPELAARYGSSAGVNAGGFNDENGRGNGGIPQGLVITEGKLVWGSPETSYQIVGLDAEGVLRVGTMTGAAAIASGIRNAVSFVTYDGSGSALLIDGVPQTQNFGSGVNPRTAIGQRADGTLMLLVLDGRSADALGATLEDLTRVLQRFGAVTAGNLDGGSSSAMVCGGEPVGFCSSVTGPRRIPTAFLVLPEEESHA